MSKFFDEQRAWDTALLCQPKEKLQNETPVYEEVRNFTRFPSPTLPRLVVPEDDEKNDEEIFFPEFYDISIINGEKKEN